MTILFFESPIVHPYEFAQFLKIAHKDKFKMRKYDQKRA